MKKAVSQKPPAKDSRQQFSLDSGATIIPGSLQDVAQGVVLGDKPAEKQPEPMFIITSKPRTAKS